MIIDLGVWALIYAKYESYFRRKIEEVFKIKVVKNNIYGVGAKLTYEGMAFGAFFAVFPPLLLSYFAFGMNFFQYLSFFIAMGLPVIFPILRIKIFSDSSILKSTGLGYYSIYCTIISFSVCVLTLVGISNLQYPFPNISPYGAIIGGIILQSIPFFPDYFNKILPFEIRTIKGYVFLGAISFIAQILVVALIISF